MTAQSSEASLQAELGHLTLHAQNFRGLARVEWSPQGVCLLTGPNGSGKSALLAALAFLREAFAGNVPRALTLLQAEAGLRRLHATESPEVVIGIKVGEASWELCSDECTGLRGGLGGADLARPGASRGGAARLPSVRDVLPGCRAQERNGRCD